MCIVSAAVAKLGEMSAGWCFMSWILDWCSRRTVVASVFAVAQWLARENPTAESWVRTRGGQNPNTVDAVLLPLMWWTLNLWFKITDGIGGRLDWAMSSDVRLLIIDYCSSWRVLGCPGLGWHLVALLFVVKEVNGFGWELGREGRRVLAKIVELGGRLKRKAGRHFMSQIWGLWFGRMAIAITYL